LRRTVIWLVSFVVLALLLLGAATFYLRGQDAARADEAKRLAAAIQASRLESVARSCRQDNDRHDATMHELDKRLAELLTHASPARRAQILSSRASTIALINALAPKRDCSRAVDAISP
jgi:Flp pilus assembly protein TadB